MISLAAMVRSMVHFMFVSTLLGAFTVAVDSVYPVFIYHFTGFKVGLN
jgi:hypothetical protein